MPVNVDYLPSPQDPANFNAAQPDPGLADYFGASLKASAVTAPVLSSLISGYTRYHADVPEENKMSVDRLNAEYGVEGRLVFEEPTSESAARIKRDHAVAQARWELIETLGNNSAGRTAVGFVAGMAGQIADPLNLALSTVGVGEANMARLSISLGSRLAARAAVGAVEGGVGAAVLEPLVLANMQYMGTDYDLEDSMASIGYSAIGGSILMAGGHLISQSIGKVRHAQSKVFYEALQTQTPELEAELHNGYLSDILEGRPSSTAGKVVEALSDVTTGRVEEFNPATGNLFDDTQSVVARQAREAFDSSVREQKSQEQARQTFEEIPKPDRDWAPATKEELQPTIEAETTAKIDSIKAKVKAQQKLEQRILKELDKKIAAKTEGAPANRTAEGKTKAVKDLQDALDDETVEISDESLRTAARELVMQPSEGPRAKKQPAKDIDQMSNEELRDFIKTESEARGGQDELGFDPDTRAEYDLAMKEADDLEAEGRAYTALAGCAGDKL